MDWLDHPLTLACGAAVLHFLWQGSFIGLIAWVLLRVQPQGRPDRRYGIACAALGLCAVSFGVTALLAARSAVPHGVPASFDPAALVGPTLPASSSWSAAQLAGLIWAAGALAMLLRFIAQAGRARRLRTLEVSAPSLAWRATFEDLKRLVGVSPGLRLLASGACRVPMVVGWWQPVVLVPASAFTGLGTDQLRSLLIHELAHLRRLDHLANALQSCVEIVLFFHPAVWLLSGLARQERECCCDAIAIQHTADPRILARALADLAALGLRQPVPQTQLAANGGPLMQRIQRILAPDSAPQQRRRGAVPLGLGLTLVSLLVIGGGTIALASPDVQEEVPVVDAEQARKQDPIVREPAAADDSANPKDGGNTPLQRFQSDLERIQLDLQALVAAGKLKPAEAKAKFDAVSKQLLMTHTAAELRRRAAEESALTREDWLYTHPSAQDSPTGQERVEQARKNLLLQELDRVAAMGRSLKQGLRLEGLSAEQAKESLEAISAQSVQLTDLREQLEAESRKSSQWEDQLAQLEQERRDIEQVMRETQIKQADILERARALNAELLRLRAGKRTASARAGLGALRDAGPKKPRSLADHLRQVELATAAGKISKEQAITSLQSIRLAMRDMENALKEQLAEENRAERLEAERLLEESF